VERGVETGHLEQSRPQPLQQVGDGQIVRHVQRRQMNQLSQAPERPAIQRHRSVEVGATMHHPVSRGHQPQIGDSPIPPSEQMGECLLVVCHLHRLLGRFPAVGATQPEADPAAAHPPVLPGPAPPGMCPVEGEHPELEAG